MNECRRVKKRNWDIRDLVGKFRVFLNNFVIFMIFYLILTYFMYFGVFYNILLQKTTRSQNNPNFDWKPPIFAVFYRFLQTLKAYNSVNFLPILDCKYIFSIYVSRAIRFNHQILQFHSNTKMNFIPIIFIDPPGWPPVTPGVQNRSKGCPKVQTIIV